MPFILVIINIGQMEEPNRNQSEEKVKRQEESDSKSEPAELGSGYESSFVVSENSDDEDEGYYGAMAYRGGHGDGDSGERRLSKKDKKKRKKKDKKHKKDKKMKRFDEEEFDEDDLEVIDNQNKLTRLKKKVKPNDSEDDFDNFRDGNGDEDEDDYNSEGEDGGRYSYHQPESEQEEYSAMNEIQERRLDIFDPNEMKQIRPNQDQIDILDNDLPERYVNLCKANYKESMKKVQEVQQMFERDDHALEANWISLRMRAQGFLESYDERDCKDRIRRVLEFIHKDHLGIMFIYYYRKKVYSDYLNLENLWKIEELDEEWHLFRQKQKKFLSLLENFLPSFTEIPPELREMISNLHEPKSLKYFEDYEKFMLAKYTSNSEVANEENQAGQNKEAKMGEKKADGKGRRGRAKGRSGHHRNEFITQMVERGVIEELESSQICITPQMLCRNINRRNQEKKPKSPELEPKEEFERMLGSSNPEIDKIRFPLLVGQNRFKTISQYLSYELFSYPELRKILRDKYYKRLVITTSPTISGAQQIDLYNQYFPVKRIKEKPISTLKRQIWILAKQAEKLGHIKLDLKFEWELIPAEKTGGERDQVYLEIIRNYYDLNNNKNSEMWNFFRKRVISTLLNDYFIPSFMREIKEFLSEEGEREIISACCAKFRQQLNKGPSLKEGRSIKILALVLEETKLGVAFIDEAGKVLHSFQTIVANDSQLREFVGGENLKFNIKEHKPDMILISANCKKAQTLRKELRSPDLFSETIFCAFGEYQVPRLVAKKRIILGFLEEESILEAISMARLKQNPMAEIISLWSDENQKNGILSMNLDPFQKFINQKRLRDALERVIIEIVNLVGLNINIIKRNEHLQSQLRFICGFGQKRSKFFLENLKTRIVDIKSRRELHQFIKGENVCRNATPFLKIESSYHKNLFQKLERDKSINVVKEYEEVNLLELTRIPEEWHKIIFKKLNDGFKSTLISEIRSKKTFSTYSRLSDENIFLLEILKNSEKIRSVEWKVKEHPYFDEELVKSELMSRFKNTRDPERVMENRQIFYNLLRETPDTLKRYMVMAVKVLSVKKNYLNVIITENGLFGYIRLQSNKTTEEYEKIYEKGTFIKCIIIGFPFDERNYEKEISTEEQELLKVEMALEFPHKDSADRQENMRHDCLAICFPSIVKSVHPSIDLEKERFELKKDDKPVIENGEARDKEKYVVRNLKPDFRRISHPKFRNISSQPAIELMKSEKNGGYIIRPSSQGPEYLTITWKFFGRVIVHIKIKCEHKIMSTMSMTYRIEDRDNRSYNSLEELVDKSVKQMNSYVEDVISNRKFLDRTIEEIENTIRKDMSHDNSHIYYYFGVSEDYPQFFMLIYMYKDKKSIKELIKVKSSGLYFHDQQFSNVRDLITWFKEHLKEKEYQRYAKNMTQQLKSR